MSLDRTQGETIALLGPHDHLPKPEVWKEYCGQLLTETKRPKANGKFGFDTFKISIFDAAKEFATQAFVAAGALLPIVWDESSFICQEYHGQGLILLIAQHKIRGEMHYVTLPFVLTKGQVRWLVTTNRWKLKDGKTFAELARKPIGKQEALEQWLSQSATPH